MENSLSSPHARQDAQHEVFYRLKTLTGITGLSRSSIYRQIKLGAFPRPVKLTPYASGWRKSDIDAWMASRESA